VSRSESNSQLLKYHTVLAQLHTTQRPSKLRVTPRRPIPRTVNLALDPVNISTSILIRPTRALNINVLNLDVRADGWTGTYDVADERVVLLACGAGEVLDCDVGDGEFGWELSAFSLASLGEKKGAWSTSLVADCEILLPVALGDFDSIVDVVENHTIIRNVLDSTTTTSTLEITGKSGRCTGPDLDARTV
jgi:hypothetical protein